MLVSGVHKETIGLPLLRHKAWHLRIQRIKQTQWITVFNQFLLKTPNRNAMTDMENESYNKTKDTYDTDINKRKEIITYLKMTRISKELHREHAPAHTRLFQKILWFLWQTNGLDVSRIHSYVQFLRRWYQQPDNYKTSLTYLHQHIFQPNCTFGKHSNIIQIPTKQAIMRNTIDWTFPWLIINNGQLTADRYVLFLVFMNNITENNPQFVF